MNEISRTTTYSGSDITVIAYRNEIDATALQKISDLQLEIAELEDLAKVSLQESRRQDAQLSQLQQPPGFLESLGDVFSSAEDVNGKAQNRVNNITNARISQSAANGINASTNAQLVLKRKELSEFIDSQTAQFELGSLHTISYSSFKEKFAVRTIGRTHAKGYTSGPRTIAGTMIFNVMQEHELLKLGINQYEEHEKTSHPNAVMLDQIKPFNLLLVFANEFGAYSSLSLFDVTLSTEGQVMSIDEAITRNEMSFLATEMLPMKSMGNAFETITQMINGQIAQNMSLTESISLSSGYKHTARLDAQLNIEEINKMRAESRGLF